jgi:hypothetical protein
MQSAAILQELESVAAALSIEVRYDELETRGGLCRFGSGDSLLLVVNERLTSVERIEVLVETMASFPFDTVFIRPQIRELLERRGSAPGMTAARPLDGH